MNRPGLAVSAAALLILGLRVLAAGFSGPWWGVDLFRCLGPFPSSIIIIAALALLGAGLFSPAAAMARQARPRRVPAWAMAAGFIALALALPHVAAPILGDGVDRIESMPAGLKALSGQPSPLDLILHVLAYRVFSGLDLPAWDLSWRVWRVMSYAAGAAGAAMVWRLASLRSASELGRAFFFIVVFFSGTALFFFGYVEDYVLLAAAIYGFFLLVELAARGRVPAGALLAGLAVLIGLHLFMLLLVPPALYTLYRHKLWKPSRTALMLLAAAVAAAGAVSLYMVHERFRGPAILVAPAALLGPYHLIGFLNQQLLACPVLPLLLGLALTGKSADGPDPLLTFTGASALIMTVFFFFLRPVIGPAADWDLFAIPSLFYAPWLALRTARRWRASPGFPVIAWQTSVLALASLAPWLMLNMNQKDAVDRFKDLMEWEAPYNHWSASFGYYRLAKYQTHAGGPSGETDAVASLARAVEINPDNPVLRLQEAQLLSALGRRDLARVQLTAHFINQGAMEEGRGGHQEAARQYRKALAVDPASKEALSALARLYDGPLHDPALAAQYKKALEQAGKESP